MQDARPAAVAGRFYPSDPAELRTTVERFLGPKKPGPALGVISPHAGLVYSGASAGKTFAVARVPEVCVVIAPNHTGMGDGRSAALWDRGSFSTPLGDVAVAADFARALNNETAIVASDWRPHLAEHAVEVILPFLQCSGSPTTIVPLVLPWDTWDECRELGRALASVVASWNTDVLLVASSDMNHFESAEIARRKDAMALESITALDAEGLLQTCRIQGVSMCGRAPAATVLHACVTLGATEATVVDYSHSGMVTGDQESVVAYAGVVIR